MQELDSQALVSPAGVVFDLDGTLLESEVAARRCFVAACEAVGWQGDVAQRDAVYQRCIGQTHAYTEQLMRTELGDTFPFAEVTARWSQLYHTLIHEEGIPLRPGIKNLLARLQALQIPMALATSSHWRSVQPKLAQAGLTEVFAHIVCGDQVEHGKPHPEPYLRASAGIQQTPDRCWALEDSEAGVRSALAAGLAVIQIPDQVPPSPACVALGHRIVSSPVALFSHLPA